MRSSFLDRAGLCSAFALAACGSPFDTGKDPIEASDSSTELDTGNHPDHALPNDAPPDVHESSTTDHDDPIDAVVPVDSGHDSPAPPEDSGCTPFGPATVLCPGDSVESTTPTQYCVYDSTQGTSKTVVTPAACTCKATYTCACLEASVTVTSELCATGQVYAECSENDVAPMVTCEDP
jgi:hypothetical protein